jgi:dTDP-4-amino-4,6-dideoxygalactose transaminase
MPFAEHVFHLYVVRVEEREALQRFLQAKGISTGIHYPIPVHLQKGYALAAYPPGSFPVAERAAREVLSLPLYPEITPGQVEVVARGLSDFGHLRRMAA